jgi:hypothetical protein
MAFEIDIKDSSIQVLLNHVSQYVDITTDPDPFYMNVDEELRERAFGDYLDTSIMKTAYIYAHTQPIPLHVDRWKRDSIYNMCVPLHKKQDVNQSLIVFDQQFEQYGLSWRLEGVDHIRHKPAVPDEVQKSVSDNDHLASEVLTGIRPCDTKDVSGLTGHDIPDHIRKLLPYGNEDFYHGLSGITWDQQPGKALMFKSSQLHCTAMQSEFKVGCVVLMSSLQSINTKEI